MASVAIAACGHEPVAPPGEDGWVGGTWAGALHHGETTISVLVWLEQDGDLVVGGGVQRELASSRPVPAPYDLGCDPVSRDSDGALGYRIPTNQGADIAVAVSLDPTSHGLVGEWAADTDAVDESGEVTFTRLAWLPTRELAAGGRVSRALGCVARPMPACADGIDNDGDGRVDADDPGCCWPGTACVLTGNREDAEPPCQNGLDDDGDGRVDALDPECTAPTGLEVGREPACGDGWDNDGDGLTDRADPGCTNDPAGRSEAGAPTGAGSGCANGDDDDGDGLIDLADPSCHGQPGRGEDARGTCDDGIDNDGDGRVDLAEASCTRIYVLDEDGSFGATSDCTDGIDNDGDGASDAADTNCYWYGEGQETAAAPWPAPPRPPDECADAIDNDADGRTDLADPDCALSDPLGAYTRFESVPGCQNGADDDGDALVDVDDPDCRSSYQSREAAGCADGADNDGDGLIDLADPTCADDPSGSEVARECSDHQDNDDDGAVDEDDPDCTAPYDWTEAAGCADHRDNDGDGLFDVADPGCSSATDDDER